jgi:hypothetical protein
MPGTQQFRHDTRPDEARRTRQKYTHPNSPILSGARLGRTSTPVKVVTLSWYNLQQDVDVYRD